MTAPLRYTPKRHTLLAEVKAGRMKVYIGFQWNLLRGEDAVVGGSNRTAVAIQPYIRTAVVRRNAMLTASLTDEGEAVLARWNTRYGAAEPLPPSRTES